MNGVNNNIGNRYKPIINRQSQKILAEITNPKNLWSTLLLEGTVVGGRSYQSYKRGGMVELKERIFEEISTSIVWLFGIATLALCIDKIAKKFNLATDADMVTDKLTKKVGYLASKAPNPIDKFTQGIKKTGMLGNAKDTLVKLKFMKLILSSAIAIYAVGSVIPKINHAWTKKLLAEQKEEVDKKQKLQSENKNSKSHQPQFKGLTNILTAITYTVENNSMAKCATVDLGVTGGRETNARNNDERLEILVRDGGSIPFYIWTTPVVAGLAAKTFNKTINTDLDSRIAQSINEKLMDKFDKPMSVEELKKWLVGDETSLISKEKLDKLTETELHLQDIQNILAENKNLKLNEDNFKKFAKLNAQSYGCDELIAHANEIAVDKSKKAESENLMKVAKELYEKTFSGKILEPEDLKKLVQNPDETTQTVINKIINWKKDGFIVKDQLNHVMQKNIINDAEFLGKSYSTVTDIANPKRFVSADELKNVHNNMKDYAQKVFEKIQKLVQNNPVTKADAEKTLNQMHKNNIMGKCAYFATGFTFSALFLSIIIPRLQCYITKVRTGSDKFPGVKDEPDLPKTDLAQK